MASGLYDKARQAFLGYGGSGIDLDWAVDKIQAVLVNTDAGYTVDFATHEFMSSVNTNDTLTTANGNRSKANSVEFANKTLTAGVADADDLTFSAVPGTVTYEALVIFAYTGTYSNATARLIAYIDSASATGFPVTSNGGDIVCQFDAGANKIFKL